MKKKKTRSTAEINQVKGETKEKRKKKVAKKIKTTDNQCNLYE